MYTVLYYIFSAVGCMFLADVLFSKLFHLKRDTSLAWGAIDAFVTASIVAGCSYYFVFHTVGIFLG